MEVSWRAVLLAVVAIGEAPKLRSGRGDEHEEPAFI